MLAHENSIFLEKQLALLVGPSLSQDNGTLVELLLAVTYYTRKPASITSNAQAMGKSKIFLRTLHWKYIP